MYYMPKCIVDDVWHEKLKNQEAYKEFCLKYNSNLVDHVENKGFGNLPWLQKYEKLYGKLSLAWFTSHDGKVTTHLYEKYIKEGDIKLEWDCVPIISTD